MSKVSEYGGIDFDALRDATAQLKAAEWLNEPVRIPAGFTSEIELAIEFADMHTSTVALLHRALRVAQDAAAQAGTDAETLKLLRLALDVAARTGLGESAECRCGWDGTGDHLCHKCHRVPGGKRVYQFHTTWGCEPCWLQHLARLRERMTVTLASRSEFTPPREQERP